MEDGFTWLLKSETMDELENLSIKFDNLSLLIDKLHCDICIMLENATLAKQYHNLISLSDTLDEICKIRCNDITNIINNVEHYTKIMGGAKKIHEIIGVCK